MRRSLLLPADGSAPPAETEAPPAQRANDTETAPESKAKAKRKARGRGKNGDDDVGSLTEEDDLPNSTPSVPLDSAEDPR